MAIPELVDLERNPFAITYSAGGYDLDGYRAALESIGSPQTGQSFIHIAGTKGKGSIAAITEAILLGLGFHAATYTSPHLLHYGERYRFDGQPWSATEFDNASNELVERFGHNGYRTAFEFLTTL